MSTSAIDTLRKPDDFGRVFSSGVKIGKTPYGMGVFSYALIPAGTPIGRVRGIVVQDENYSSDYCIAAGDGLALEPAPPFCYLNHSCEPNCEFMHYVREEDCDGTEVEGNLTRDELDSLASDFYECVEEAEDEECYFSEEDVDSWNQAGEGVDERDEENEEDEEAGEEGEQDDRELSFNDIESGVEIWVETKRDILPGEQLTIDYSWPSDRAMQCLCGAKTCRGWIVDPAELDDLCAETS
ncbi:MAG: hypothetical protein ACRC10_07795 [Thermoguttaceae bacterium]